MATQPICFNNLATEIRVQLKSGTNNTSSSKYSEPSGKTLRFGFREPFPSGNLTRYEDMSTTLISRDKSPVMWLEAHVSIITYVNLVLPENFSEKVCDRCAWRSWINCEIWSLLALLDPASALLTQPHPLPIPLISRPPHWTGLLSPFRSLVPWFICCPWLFILLIVPIRITMQEKAFRHLMSLSTTVSVREIRAISIFLPRDHIDLGWLCFHSKTNSLYLGIFPRLSYVLILLLSNYPWVNLIQRTQRIFTGDRRLYVAEPRKIETE